MDKMSEEDQKAQTFSCKMNKPQEYDIQHGGYS